MNWRNPEIELPKEGQKVWIMLEPHKDRGSLLESAMSIQVVCGEATYLSDGKACLIENGDELGSGDIAWVLGDYESDYSEYAFAWLPVEEFIYPGFRK